MTPSAARPQGGRAAPPSYIGLPQRFCEAKDLWEEGEGGVKSVAVAVRRSLAYAPCGDAVTPSVTVSACSRTP